MTKEKKIEDCPLYEKGMCFKRLCSLCLMPVVLKDEFKHDKK